MKLAHTSLTVKNMDESLGFYCGKLGFKLLSRREIPENNAEITFVTDGVTSHRLELTHWRQKQDYTSGDELDHIALEVEDLDGLIDTLRTQEVTIAKEPYRLSGSTKRIAFIQDPNGIWIELLEA